MAKEKFVRLPGGKELVFPATMSDTEIRMQVLDQILGPVPSFELGPEPKREAGFTGGFGEGISTLGGLPEAVQYLARPTGERRKAAAEAGESEYDFQRLRDIEGLGGLGRFVKEQAGSALGFIAAPAAAAAAAARATPAPIKPFAATGAFLTAAGAQYLTNTTTRQAAEQEVRVKEGKAPELPDATKIALTSAAQAGLDVAGFRLFRPLGEILGLAGRENAEKALKEVAETAAKDPVKAAEKVLGKKSIAAGVVTGAAFEAAQEVAQQALERYGAGLDLASDDALSEYFESAVGGGLLGGPIGGASTYAGNVRKGIYNKDFLQQTADAVQGKTINLNKEWDNYSKQIHIDAPTFDLTDDQGNFLTYTPDLLERLGINPEAKAINVGGKDRVTIPMSEILKTDTGNETVGKALMYMFRNDRLKLGEEIKNSAKLMEPDVLAEKVKEYETLTAALKTYEAFFNPKQAVNSPTNFVVQQSPTDPKKFIVFNPVTGTNVANQNFASAENAQKYIDRKLEQEKKGNIGPEVLMPEDLEVQADPIKPGVFTVFNKKTGKYDTKKEFKTEVEAQEYVDKKLGVPPAKETVAARQAQDAQAQLYKDLAARYPDNPDAVKEITTMAKDLEATMSPTEALAQAETTYLQDQEAAAETTAPKATVTDITPKIEAREDAELEAGILEDEAQRGRTALTPQINNEIQEALNLARQAVYENSTIEKRGPTFFPEDTTTAQEFVAGVHNLYKGLEEGTLPNAVRSVELLREQANALKQTFQQRIADREAYEKRGKPDLTVVKPKAPRTRKKPTGQPYEKYTAQMREMLAGVDPESGLAEDLNEFINLAEESKDTTIAKELSQLAQTYAQATRDSTNPNLSQMEQDRALERASNIFETLKEVGQKSTPQNAAEMKAAKDATGNAETANKVAAKVTKDVCG